MHSDMPRYRPPSTPYDLLWSRECGGPVISVACTPTCGRIVAGAVDRGLYVFNFEGDAADWHTKSLDDEVWSVAISADGRRIAAGTASKKPSRGTLYIYNGLGGQLGKFSLEAPI